MSSLWIVLLSIASMGLIYYGAMWLDGAIKKKEKKDELERSEMEAASKRRIEEADRLAHNHKTIQDVFVGTSINRSMPSVSEKLAMAQVKCIQCGASIDEGSKFCKHCGTKVPDNVFRADIKIEDQAEEKRVEYENELAKKQLALEEKESRLRQKKMKKELRKGRYVKCCGIMILIGLLILAIGTFVFPDLNVMGTGGIIAGLGFLGIMFKLLIE